MSQVKKAVFFALFASSLQSCFLTKLVSVPMRITGAAASAVPFIGEPIHKSVDKGAEIIDQVPL